MTRALALSAMLALAACAPPGYHYKTYTLTIEPDDPCMRPEVTSQGAVNMVNASVGRPDGPRFNIVQISSPASMDANWLASLRLPRYEQNFASVPLLCHATFELGGGAAVSGIFAVHDPGNYDNGVSRGQLWVSWISDRDITNRMIELRNLPPGTDTYYPLGRETSFEIND